VTRDSAAVGQSAEGEIRGGRCASWSVIIAALRDQERFPSDFMFQLLPDEFEGLRYYFGTSKSRGGRRCLPYAFTEQGIAMLSSVLRSPRAIAVNVEIMRAFVRLRRMLASNADLARKLTDLERKYDAQFRVVFDAIRQLMAPPEKPRRSIGFKIEEGRPVYRRPRRRNAR